MNPRETALGFWRHDTGMNSDELRSLIMKHMPTTDNSGVPYAPPKIAESFEAQDIMNILETNRLARAIEMERSEDRQVEKFLSGFSEEDKKSLLANQTEYSHSNTDDVIVQNGVMVILEQILDTLKEISAELKDG